MDNNWQEWKERIVGYTRKIKQADRGQKRTRLAILFLCGLLLLVVAVPVPKTGEVDKDTKIDGESGKGETYETDSMADYEKYLEQKTAQTLGVVDGAGKVTVMITLKSTGQKVVEKDQQSTHQTTKEADSQGTGSGGHSCNSRWRWECSCREESDRSGAGIIWCRSA